MLAITLAAVAPFAAWYMNKALELDPVRAALCMLGALYFIFREPATT